MRLVEKLREDRFFPSPLVVPLVVAIIVIPTTAGPGSECQSFALISEAESHNKMACGDPKAAAKIAILDPELTLSQPRNVTACTGIDAIAHAVETAVTRKRNETSLKYSRAAFQMMLENFSRVLESPDDLEARGQMLLGAAYAGTAIEHSMLGAAHSAANPLTAHFDVIHGQAVGMMLPHVVRFNAAAETIAGFSLPVVMMIKESVNQTLDNMGFYNSLQSCFTLHQLNHSHWSQVRDDKRATAGPENGVPDWRDAPPVALAVKDQVRAQQ